MVSQTTAHELLPPWPFVPSHRPSRISLGDKSSSPEQQNPSGWMGPTELLISEATGKQNHYTEDSLLQEVQESA
jgi:hypothetical protein